jgi:hypothetical protein
LRQTHAPGEKLFVDYSGDKVAMYPSAEPVRAVLRG